MNQETQLQKLTETVANRLLQKGAKGSHIRPAGQKKLGIKSKGLFVHPKKIEWNPL